VLFEFLGGSGRFNRRNIGLELPISGGSSGPEQSREERVIPQQLPKHGSSFTFVGKYELVQELSRGGMGIIYKARDSALNREVALKRILSGQFASQVELERFRIEAEAAAHLDHPNIVPIYDIGEEEGQPYFTMKLITGSNLARLNSQCTLRDAQWLRRSAETIAKVASAVQHAHERGILHRDLKPSNILVDEQGEPLITDFGLAKLARQDRDLTLTGATVGTPNYMAPEQASGEAKQLTTAADIFSLGAILYELLTGQAPFHADTPVLTVKKLLETEPRRPRLSNRAVDPDLETICLKSLEKEPKRRYETARKFAQDLDHWLKGEPIHARPVSVAARLLKWARREPALTALIVVSLAALVGFVSVTRYNLRETRNKLAQTLLSGGEALASKNSLARGKEQVRQAYELFRQTGASTLPADLSLLDIYRSGPPALLSLNAHAGRATCVAVRPDQHTVVSGGDDGMIKLWSFPLSRELATWNAHTGGVDCLAFSPDGRFCVSAGKDSSLKVWDIALSALIRTIPVNGGAISISFSTNSNVFATACRDHTIKIWELSSGKVIQTVKTGQDQISQIAFSPVASRVLAANANGGITIWNLDEPPHKRQFNPLENCLAVAYSPDGALTLRGDAQGAVKLYQSESSQTGKSNMRMVSAVTTVAFSANGRRILAGARDGSISVWDLAAASREPSVRLADAEESVTAISTFGDNRLAIAASRDGKIRIWDTDPNQSVRRLHAADFTVSRALFSPDGLSILSVDGDGQLKLWDAATRFLLLTAGEHEGNVYDVAFAQDGRQAVAGGEDKIVRIWDVHEGRELKKFPAVSAPIRSIRFSTDNKMVIAGEGPLLTPEELASLGPDKRSYKLHVWSIEGQEIQTLTAHTGGVLAIACSPDGKTVLTGGADGQILFWDASTWRQTRALTAERVTINGLAFAGDGTRFVSAGSSSSLTLWDTATGRSLHSYGEYGDEVLCTSVSRDDSLLLAGTDHGDLVLWSLATGGEIHTFGQAHTWSIYGAEFSPKGDLVVSASADSDIGIWELSRAETDRRLGIAAAQARLKLQGNTNDSASLRVLGQWYEHRGIWPWAIELFEQARNCGADVAHLSLARCYWNNNQLKAADQEFILAEKAQEAPAYYTRLCQQAIAKQVQDNLRLAALRSSTNWTPVAISSNTVILQPGPNNGKDIWTSSYYSWAQDGDTPGGGLDDYELQVGGCGDTSYTLMQFNLTGGPTNAKSVLLGLYCFSVDGTSPRLYLDRITQHWDWKTNSAARDRLRLWWADRPTTTQFRAGPLPAPIKGGWYFIDITDLYNDWQAGRVDNFGLQLRPPPSRNQRIARFYSSDFTDDPNLRPKLIITPEVVPRKDGPQPHEATP
jgi:WD40 repeat protein/tRNA A-37 threonylcarbamoyl transferase component Bud32